MTFEEWIATTFPNLSDEFKQKYLWIVEEAWEARVPEATHEVVPIEPTEKMLERGLAYCGTRHSLDQAYAAMVQAAQE